MQCTETNLDPHRICLLVSVDAVSLHKRKAVSGEQHIYMSTLRIDMLQLGSKRMFWPSFFRRNFCSHASLECRFAQWQKESFGSCRVLQSRGPKISCPAAIPARLLKTHHCWGPCLVWSWGISAHCIWDLSRGLFLNLFHSIGQSSQSTILIGIYIMGRFLRSLICYAPQISLL